PGGERANAAAIQIDIGGGAGERLDQHLETRMDHRAVANLRGDRSADADETDAGGAAEPEPAGNADGERLALVMRSDIDRALRLDGDAADRRVRGADRCIIADERLGRAGDIRHGDSGAEAG